MRAFMGLEEAPAAAGGISGMVSSESVLGLATVGTDLANNPCPCCKLTLKQRLYGFSGCFAVGVLLSICSTLALYKADYGTFAVLYSFGNLISIFATGFLIGPVSQCKNMFHKKRIGATIFYLSTLLVTLIVAFAYRPESTILKTLLILFLVFMQMLALTWYTLSYIPFARDAVIACAKSCCKLG